jgi:Ni,Fe-hydrogenase III small subunit
MLKILLQMFRTGVVTEGVPAGRGAVEEAGVALEKAVMRRFRRSVAIRFVDAGSCNACELEAQAMGNPIYNCERFGIRFTASPRFADIIMVSGPVTRNMEVALRRTYDAAPDPKLVVAIGDCARDCGVFGNNYATIAKAGDVIPVDYYILGCPPAPADILGALLKLLQGKSR